MSVAALVTTLAGSGQLRPAALGNRLNLLSSKALFSWFVLEKMSCPTGRVK